MPSWRCLIKVPAKWLPESNCVYSNKVVRWAYSLLLLAIYTRSFQCQKLFLFFFFSFFSFLFSFLSFFWKNKSTHETVQCYCSYINDQQKPCRSWKNIKKKRQEKGTMTLRNWSICQSTKQIEPNFQ